MGAMGGTAAGAGPMGLDVPQSSSRDDLGIMATGGMFAVPTATPCGQRRECRLATRHSLRSQEAFLRRCAIGSVGSSIAIVASPPLDELEKESLRRGP